MTSFRARRLLSLAGAALSLSLALPARADGSNAAAAQALFDQGKELMSKGKPDEACPKFAESQKLDPGMGTLLNLAACYEAGGRFASAWSTFLEAESAAQAAGSAEGLKVSRERAAALAPKLSKLVITVTGAPAGLEVQRDGVVVGSAQWGVGIPADPGRHTVTATAAGKLPFQKDIEVVEAGATIEVKVPELAPAPVEATAPVAPPPSPAPPPASSESGGLGGQRYAAIGVGVLGVAGVAVGSVFGLKSKSKHDDAESHCDGGNCFDTDGVALREDARSAGNVATVAFIVGGVGLAGAAVLWFTGGPSDEPKTGLVIGPGRLALRGTF